MIFPREAHTSKYSYFIRSVVMAKAYFNMKEKRHIYSHTIYNFELFACSLSCINKTKQNKTKKPNQNKRTQKQHNENFENS